MLMAIVVPVGQSNGHFYLERFCDDIHNAEDTLLLKLAKISVTLPYLNCSFPNIFKILNILSV